MLGTTTTRDTGLYVVAQVVGGCLGTILANLMFELPAVELSTTDQIDRRAHALLAELLAEPVDQSENTWMPAPAQAAGF